MWDEGIQMARTAYALDAAIEIGDSRKVKEIARILSGQVKDIPYVASIDEQQKGR